MQSEFEKPGDGSENAESTRKQSKLNNDSVGESKTSLLDVDSTRSKASQLSSTAMNAVKDSSKKHDIRTLWIVIGRSNNVKPTIRY